MGEERILMPSKRIFPLGQKAGGEGKSLGTDIATELLPLPDSPTIAKTSPLSNERQTLRAAFVTTPSSFLNETSKFSISSNIKPALQL
jgi:hypothetical protein